MNNLWKPIGVVFLVVVLFFLYSYALMVAWNSGVVLAIPGLNNVDFFASCWVMFFLFLLKLVFMKYPSSRSKDL